MKIFDHSFRNTFSRATVYLFCTVGIVLGSCSRDEADVMIKNTGSGKYVTVRLNLPYIHTNQPGTRAMTPQGENTLDPDLLTVMVVLDTNDPNSALQRAALVGDIVYEEADRSKATITVEVPADDTNEIRLCVVANHSIVGSAANYAQFRQDQVLDVADAWPDTKSIPMWGETGGFIANDAMATQTVDMYRALARIDVGLNFTIADGRFTETTTGIAGFKLNSIAVYGTKTQIYVSPATIPPDGVSVNAPGDSYSRDETNPLVYGPLGGVDSYVREIYVPESGISSDRNLLHCVVVGGFLDGSTTETFYRLDFATYNTTTGKTQLPILRNHRYVFNIKEVSADGYATRELAFANEGALSDRVIVYNIDILDDFIHRVEVEGGNYFGLDNRDIIFEPDESLSAVIRYRTDLPATTPVTYTWDNPSAGAARYNVNVDQGAHTITITTNTNNISGSMYDDVLYVVAGQFKIPVRIAQKSVIMRYSLVCSSIVVHGVYVIGQTLDASHYIELTISADDDSLNGQTYIIETEELNGNHGISFSDTGVFNFDPVSYTMDIRLESDGTLLAAAGDTPFTVTIRSNSSLGASCQVTIVPVYSVMNVLVMCSDSGNSGYDISNPNGGSGKVVNSTSNFGPYNNSVVKVSGFNYISASDNLDFGASGGDANANGYKWVTGTGNNGKLADMVYIANSGVLSEETAALLAAYLVNGGVIVCFIEDVSTAMHLANNVFGVTSITTESVTGTGGYLFPMPANRAMFANIEDQQNAVVQYAGDAILKGPFGDLRETQVGSDSDITVTWSSLPSGFDNVVTIYSYMNNLNVDPPITDNTSRIVGFKLEEPNGRNIFFWGDKGMMTCGTDGNPNTTGYTVNPFDWDPTTLFPLPMPSYGSDPAYRLYVDNSAMFNNALSWAINRSNKLRQKRADFEDNFVNP